MPGPSQLIHDGGKIVLVGKNELQYLSGSYLTSAILTAKDQDDVARSLAGGLAFLHSKNICLGEGINAQNIFILKSEATGCHAVFASLDDSGSRSREEDVLKLADLLESVWTSGQDRKYLTFAQDALLVRMRNRLPHAPSMNEISKHVAFWPKEKTLDFFIAVSEVLELKQKRHRESVEDESHKVICISWHLDPVVRELVEQVHM